MARSRQASEDTIEDDAEDANDERPAGPRLRVKVRLPGGVIGGGKIALLERIERAGSISAAARELGMSFRRAWHLIDTLHQALDRQVVETSVGGARGGGARLTPFGRELVQRYRRTMAALDAEAAPLLAWIVEDRPAGKD